METMSKSIIQFSCDIFKEINSSNSNSNILCSPTSIASLLSLVMLGSNGDTAFQIKKALHISDEGSATSPPETLQTDGTQSGDECQQTAFGSDKVTVVPEVHKKLKAFFDELKSGGDSELKSANGLFAQLKFPISQDYQSSAQALYHANLKSVDFEKDKTREDINTWIENETSGKIKNFFAPKSLEKNTSLILVNAIYFKDKWMKMFKKEDTKDAPFHVKEDANITVRMMKQTATFNYGDIKEMDAQVIELQYSNGHFSMFIILPNTISGLPKVIGQLTLESLMKWTDPKNLSKTKLEIYIPSFKIEESYDLTSHLQNMGIVDAFSIQKANLSGISKTGLYVSKVIHKAFIEVNEEGTEAAAASGAVIVPKSLLLPNQFKVDRPFVCLIKDNQINNILFLSKVTSPSS